MGVSMGFERQPIIEQEEQGGHGERSIEIPSCSPCPPCKLFVRQANYRVFRLLKNANSGIPPASNKSTLGSGTAEMVSVMSPK